MKYVEEFKILGVTYGISKASDWMDKNAKGYMAWHGGCGIGNAPDVIGCRKIIFEFAKGEGQELLQKSRVGVAAAEYLLATLGSDVFNLGIFRVKGKE